MKKLTISICALLALSVPATAKTLTAAEIQTEIVGKRLKWETTDGFVGVTRYSKNGKAKVSFTKPNRFKDKGKWWIKGNKLCNQWETIRDGKSKCFTFRVKGPKTYGGPNITIKTN